MREIENLYALRTPELFWNSVRLYWQESGAKRREGEMFRALRIHLLVVIIAALTVGALAACGGAGESADAPGETVVVEREVIKEVQVPGETVVVEKEVVREVAVEKVVTQMAMPAAPAPALAVVPGQSGSPGPEGASLGIPDLDQIRAQLVTQQRIIVRTVDMTLVVDDIQGAIDSVADLAVESDGWVVSSDRSLKHQGSVSVRVPSNLLDDVIGQIRGLADEVEMEVTSSQDVTDEYVDLRSRLSNQEATEEALLKLFGRADRVEDALDVQEQVSAVQQTIERLKGRIKLLEETAAFSLITVFLKLSTVEMDVDAGADRTVAAGAPIRFRATFTPPAGIEDYRATWDFGDGSPVEDVFRTAPTLVEGERVTATLAHTFHSPEDSPYIVSLEITGTGAAGIAVGDDTVIVTVSEIPAIEVFAGRRKNVNQNEEVEFSGSFTRPSGLSNVRFHWDFGDGSEPVEGAVPEGVTVADATHVYENFRPDPYTARLTIKADSEVGEVESSDEFLVFVSEDPGLVAEGFEAGETTKTAFRSLTVVVQALIQLGIWLVIFSPIWGVIAVLAWLSIRRQKRRNAENRTRLAAEQQDAAQRMADAREQSAGSSD